MNLERIIITYRVCVYKDTSKNPRSFVSHTVEDLENMKPFAYGFNGLVENVVLITSEGLKDVTGELAGVKRHIGSLLIDTYRKFK